MLGIGISIICGIILGLFFRNDMIINNVDSLVSFGLCLLLFFVGMDIGDNGDIFNSLKKYGKKVWLLPLSTIIGSGIGGYLGAILTKIGMGEGIAVSMGLGWYSLSAIELSKISAELGSVAFLTNVLREIISIFTVPFIAKYIGSLESVSVAGATAMDTLLPIINRSNSSDISVVAFFSGMFLTTAVPFLVTTTISIFGLM
ncbi:MULTISPECIES: lysine exporter LysO family protein [Fusobacterium]|uniref:lysine exporter LysO family protein n=1 Tax=Fusobacterium TaxID=848 RepID=UPI001476C0E6|nr:MULTISPECIES: lysine exporter LysO family protein [Fusobacterium]NME35951.1 lysine exporter LysO family protein [Fusobacterium sp. FSA-380-WT-3A]